MVAFEVNVGPVELEATDEGVFENEFFFIIEFEVYGCSVELLYRHVLKFEVEFFIKDWIICIDFNLCIESDVLKFFVFGY
jgi:hypothetical protein